jgi:hypothetical protein
VQVDVELHRVRRLGCDRVTAADIATGRSRHEDSKVLCRLPFHRIEAGGRHREAQHPLSELVHRDHTEVPAGGAARFGKELLVVEIAGRTAGHGRGQVGKPSGHASTVARTTD